METFFAGRRRELAAADTLIDAVVRGEGAALWIEAPAGYGKSGLARRVASQARSRGLAVINAPVVGSQELPSLGPWGRILAKVDALAPEVKGSALALLSSDWAQSDSLGGANATERKFALFEHIGRHLREVSRSRRLCLVLEDLHGYDSLSLQLLEYLADVLESAPVLFVLTLRPVAPGPGPLKDLAAWMGQAEYRYQVLLSPLTEEELSEALLPSVNPSHSATDLFRWTRGVPYLLSLVLELGFSTAGFQEGVDLGRRFWSGLKGRLSPGAQEAVVRIALLGHRARRSDLGWEESVAARALGELSQRGLVRETDSGEFHLFHEEFGAAVLGSLSVPEKDEVLTRLVDAWEESRRDEDDTGLLVLKGLCLLGSLERFGARARTYRMRVVEQHRNRGAWPEVLAEVSALLDTAPDHLDEATAWDLKYWYCVARARAESWLPGEGAVATLVAVTEHAIQLGQWDRFIDLIQTPYFMLDPVPEVEEMIQTVLDRMDPRSPGRITLLTIYSEILFRRRGQRQKAREMLNQALEACQGGHAPDEEHRARVHLASQHFFLRDYDEALRMLKILLNRDRSQLGREVSLMGLVLKSFALYSLGRMEQCRVTLVEVLQLRSLYRSDFWNHIALSRLVRLDLLKGDWATAFSHAAAGRNHFFIAVPQVVTLCLQGQFDQADAAIEKFRGYLLGLSGVLGSPVSGALGWVMAVRTYLAGDRRWVAAAEEILDRFLNKTDRVLDQIHFGIIAGRITRVATDDRHRSLALSILDETIPYAFEEEDYTVHAARALLLETLDRPQDSLSAWERAIAQCDVVGERPWRAHHQFELSLRVKASDPARAARLLAAAEQTAAELGLSPLAGWIQAERTPTARPVSVTTSSPGLTPRENEILRGLVAGMSDKALAFRLGVSPFTVGNHLRSIYSKLGRNSRLEAAQWAAQVGMTALD